VMRGESVLFGQFYPLLGIGAAIDIMFGVVDPFRLEEFIEGGRYRLSFINNLFEIDGLVAELPEVMFGIVLVAVGKKSGTNASTILFCFLRGVPRWHGGSVWPIGFSGPGVLWVNSLFPAPHLQS